MTEDEIKDETETALIKRIHERDQSGVLLTTMTVIHAGV